MKILAALGYLLACVSAHATSLSLTSAGPNGFGGSPVSALICSNGDNGIANTVSCTTTAAVPAGDSILVVIGTVSAVSATISSVTDGGDTFGQLRAQTDFTDSSSEWHWFTSSSVGISSGATITATYSGSIASHFIAAYAFNQQVFVGTGGAASHIASATLPSCATIGSVAASNSVVGSAGPMVFGGTAAQTGWTIDYDTVYASTHRVTLGHTSTNSAGAITFSPTGYTGTSGWSCIVEAFSPTYLGPGNLISGATVWYGLRCYTLANAGGNSIRIRRASDNAESDITLTSSCNLDTATASSFCNATSCFAKTIYDQSGNGINLTQATAGNQPALLFNCQGSLACLNPDGARFLSGTLSGSLSQPFTEVSLVERTAAFTTEGDILFNLAATGVISGFSATTGKVFAYDSTGNISRTATAANSALHVLQFIFNGGSSNIRVNGTDTAIVLGAAAADTAMSLLGRPAAVVPMTGFWMESGVWPSAFSTGQMTDMCNNVHLYWSTATACQ